MTPSFHRHDNKLRLQDNFRQWDLRLWVIESTCNNMTQTYSVLKWSRTCRKRQKIHKKFCLMVLLMILWYGKVSIGCARENVHTKYKAHLPFPLLDLVLQFYSFVTCSISIAFHIHLFVRLVFVPLFIQTCRSHHLQHTSIINLSQ